MRDLRAHLPLYQNLELAERGKKANGAPRGCRGSPVIRVEYALTGLHRGKEKEGESAAFYQFARQRVADDAHRLW
jgi:hypothetical protein